MKAPELPQAANENEEQIDAEEDSNDSDVQEERGKHLLDAPFYYAFVHPDDLASCG